MSITTDPDPHDWWQEAAPRLEELVQQLGRRDRDVILLRFYRQQSLLEVGQTLGISEEAARKRVTRAVDQLRDLFNGAGLTLPAGGLATILRTEVTKAAPAELIASAASMAAGTAGANAIAMAKGVVHTMLWAKVKAAAVAIAALLILIAAGAGVQQMARSPLASTLPTATQPAPQIRGIVVAADGARAKGATVVPCLRTRPTIVFDGVVQQEAAADQVLTDEEGMFALPAQKDLYAVLVGHDLGFALVSLMELRASEQVRLQGWASVEGRLRIGNKPAGGETICLSFDPRELASFPAQGRILLDYITQTDADGQFTFPGAPPLVGTISRQVTLRTWPDPDGGVTTRVTRAVLRGVLPESGKILTLDLGGIGRPVVGRLNTPNTDQEPLDWTWFSARVHRNQSQPSPPAGLSETERKRWLTSWYRTPPGQTYQEQRWTGVGVVQADGTFRIEDVPSGEYTLRVLGKGPPEPGAEAGHDLGELETKLVVPAGAEREKDYPLDIGRLEVPATRPAKQ